jgi:hypothetical protein
VRVLGISWLGVRTDAFAELARFAEETLGLTRMETADDFAVFEAADGDSFEIFGAGGPFAPQQFARNRVVGGFLVDDIDGARAELAAAPGVELLGEVDGDAEGYRWQHFVAPDGHVYELAYDPERARR